MPKKKNRTVKKQIIKKRSDKTSFGRFTNLKAFRKKKAMKQKKIKQKKPGKSDQVTILQLLLVLLQIIWFLLEKCSTY